MIYQDRQKKWNYEWAEYVEVLEEIARQTKNKKKCRQTENLRNGITDLCKYGMRVGFTSIEFYSACEEAFVNADRPDCSSS